MKVFSYIQGKYNMAGKSFIYEEIRGMIYKAANFPFAELPAQVLRVFSQHVSKKKWICTPFYRNKYKDKKISGVLQDPTSEYAS